MSLISKLERRSEEEQEYLEGEINKITEKGKTIAINGLFIAGGLALSYLLFKYLVDDSKPAKKSKSIKIEKDQSEQITKSVFGGVARSIAKEALLFALALSKDKLVEYLNKVTESNEEHPSGTTK